MKIINSVLLCITIFLLITAVIGCGQVQQYGQTISKNKITEISKILTKPGSYEGKTVTIEGKIITECPTGCWFDLKDESGVIYVDLKPSGFAIPQKTGHKVTVQGEVEKKNEKIVIIGKGVEIR
ncbi:MAG: DUF4920 domain-containing protein [Candidatus Omnitrophica bacterium]|nr:DUF4920 domain-containing protein [Candidatus Omnitrophota bacterium]